MSSSDEDDDGDVWAAYDDGTGNGLDMDVDDDEQSSSDASAGDRDHGGRARGDDRSDGGGGGDNGDDDSDGGSRDNGGDSGRRSASSSADAVGLDGADAGGAAARPTARTGTAGGAEPDTAAYAHGTPARASIGTDGGVTNAWLGRGAGSGAGAGSGSYAGSGKSMFTDGEKMLALNAVERTMTRQAWETGKEEGIVQLRSKDRMPPKWHSSVTERVFGAVDMVGTNFPSDVDLLRSRLLSSSSGLAHRLRHMNLATGNVRRTSRGVSTFHLGDKGSREDEVFIEDAPCLNPYDGAQGFDARATAVWGTFTWTNEGRLHMARGIILHMADVGTPVFLKCEMTLRTATPRVSVSHDCTTFVVWDIAAERAYVLVLDAATNPTEPPLVVERSGAWVSQNAKLVLYGTADLSSMAFVRTDAQAGGGVDSRVFMLPRQLRVVATTPAHQGPRVEVVAPNTKDASQHVVFPSFAVSQKRVHLLAMFDNSLLHWVVVPTMRVASSLGEAVMARPRITFKGKWVVEGSMDARMVNQHTLLVAFAAFHLHGRVARQCIMQRDGSAQKQQLPVGLHTLRLGSLPVPQRGQAMFSSDEPTQSLPLLSAMQMAQHVRTFVVPVTAQAVWNAHIIDPQAGAFRAAVVSVWNTGVCVAWQSHTRLHADAAAHHTFSMVRETHDGTAAPEPTPDESLWAVVRAKGIKMSATGDLQGTPRNPTATQRDMGKRDPDAPTTRASRVVRADGRPDVADVVVAGLDRSGTLVTLHRTPRFGELMRPATARATFVLHTYHLSRVETALAACDAGMASTCEGPQEFHGGMDVGYTPPHLIVAPKGVAHTYNRFSPDLRHTNLIGGSLLFPRRPHSQPDPVVAPDAPTGADVPMVRLHLPFSDVDAATRASSPLETPSMGRCVLQLYPGVRSAGLLDVLTINDVNSVEFMSLLHRRNVDIGTGKAEAITFAPVRMPRAMHAQTGFSVFAQLVELGAAGYSSDYIMCGARTGNRLAFATGAMLWGVGMDKGAVQLHNAINKHMAKPTARGIPTARSERNSVAFPYMWSPYVPSFFLQLWHVAALYRVWLDTNDATGKMPTDLEKKLRGAVAAAQRKNLNDENMRAMAEAAGSFVSLRAVWVDVLGHKSLRSAVQEVRRDKRITNKHVAHLVAVIEGVKTAMEKNATNAAASADLWNAFKEFPGNTIFNAKAWMRVGDDETTLEWMPRDVAMYVADAWLKQLLKSSNAVAGIGNKRARRMFPNYMRDAQYAVDRLATHIEAREQALRDQREALQNITAAAASQDKKTEKKLKAAIKRETSKLNTMKRDHARLEDDLKRKKAHADMVTSVIYRDITVNPRAHRVVMVCNTVPHMPHSTADTATVDEHDGPPSLSASSATLMWETANMALDRVIYQHPVDYKIGEQYGHPTAVDDALANDPVNTMLAWDVCLVNRGIAVTGSHGTHHLLPPSLRRTRLFVAEQERANKHDRLPWLLGVVPQARKCDLAREDPLMLDGDHAVQALTRRGHGAVTSGWSGLVVVNPCFACDVPSVMDVASSPASSPASSWMSTSWVLHNPVARRNAGAGEASRQTATAMSNGRATTPATVLERTVQEKLLGGAGTSMVVEVEESTAKAQNRKMSMFYEERKANMATKLAHHATSRRAKKQPAPVAVSHSLRQNAELQRRQMQNNDNNGFGESLDDDGMWNMLDSVFGTPGSDIRPTPQGDIMGQFGGLGSDMDREVAMRGLFS